MCKSGKPAKKSADFGAELAAEEEGGSSMQARKLKIKAGSVLGMSLRKVTLLGSNLASVTVLKRIQTPHSLCCDFRGYKTVTTRWSGGRVQV